MQSKYNKLENVLAVILTAVLTAGVGAMLIMLAMQNDNQIIRMHQHSATPYVRLAIAEQLVAQSIPKDSTCWYESVHYVMYRVDSEIRGVCYNQLPPQGE